MGKFSVRAIGNGQVELGVSAGAERYDAATGTLANVAVVDLDELDEAITTARKEGKAVDKNARDFPLTPHIDPNHPSADSSFRSEDRPPIYISSDTNPSEMAPTPVTPAEGGPSGIDRLPSGLADVVGNSGFDKAPGPNIATPPEGVAAPKPEKAPKEPAPAKEPAPTTQPTQPTKTNTRPAMKASRTRARATAKA